jgi:hypothetical protein
MSVFRVKLTNSIQGIMSGASQRSAYLMGPTRRIRELKDGEEFTDCNYWKRFAYPQTSLENAFIEVIFDDGIQYLDGDPKNPPSVNFPKVYDLVAAPESDYDENTANILGETGGSAVFAQITNKSQTEDVKLKLNNLSTAIIDLPAGSTQVFNAGDVSIGIIQVKNESASEVKVQILVSVAVIPNS